MCALLGFVLAVLTSPFKSRSRLEAANAALRHQLIVLRRGAGKRVRLAKGDRGRQSMSRMHACYKMDALVRGTNIVRRELGLPEAHVPATDEKLSMAPLANG